MGKEVTLSDVAREAGVDLSTASRALRGTGRVSEATRERIREAALRLDFRPNAQAQFLARGISKTVGVLTINAPGTFTLPVMAGVNARLGRDDIATLLYDVHYDEQVLDERVRAFRARNVDALLVLGDGLRAPLHSVTARLEVPVVYAFATSDSAEDTWFMPDGRMAGRLAAEHLVGLGRRKIAHITSKDDIAADERTQGLIEALHGFGLELALGAPLRGDWTRRWGATAASRILGRIDEVDAIFCGNDQIALGVYEVLRAADIRIPERVALVGFDDWEGMVNSGDHLLTTIDPQLGRLGEEAAEALLRALDGAELAAGAHHVACTLVPGETTTGAGDRTQSDPVGLI